MLQDIVKNPNRGKMGLIIGDPLYERQKYRARQRAESTPELEGVPCVDCGRFCRQQCEIVENITAESINIIRQAMLDVLAEFKE